MKAQLGRLIAANPAGGWNVVADVGDVDFAWTAARPELVPGQFPDANPYGVLAGVGEHWVVDAGSNTLDRVHANGSVDVVAFIPNPPASDVVPTCIDRGPDGALYIGELTGGGNTPGSSIVWRYSPRDQTLTQWATGLTAVTGCGLRDGRRVYAVEFSTLGLDNAAPGTGALVRVAAHSSSPLLILGGLSFPGGSPRRQAPCTSLIGASRLPRPVSDRSSASRCTNTMPGDGGEPSPRHTLAQPTPSPPTLRSAITTCEQRTPR